MSGDLLAVARKLARSRAVPVSVLPHVGTHLPDHSPLLESARKLFSLSTVGRVLRELRENAVAIYGDEGCLPSVAVPAAPSPSATSLVVATAGWAAAHVHRALTLLRSLSSRLGDFLSRGIVTIVSVARAAPLASAAAGTALVIVIAGVYYFRIVLPRDLPAAADDAVRAVEGRAVDGADAEAPAEGGGGGGGVDRPLEAAASAPPVNPLVAAAQDALVCPLGGYVMIDPVMLHCGHHFDRTAITNWITVDSPAHHGTPVDGPAKCPACERPTRIEELVPMHALRAACDAARQILPRPVHSF